MGKSVQIIRPTKIDVQAVARGAETGDLEAVEHAARLNGTPRETTEPGHDGQPPVMGDPRDLDGAGKRNLPGTQNLNCDRLDWFWNHGQLTDREHDAGLRLQADWQVAQLSAYTTASQIGGVTAAKLSLADAKLDAMERHGRVLAPCGARSRIIVTKVVQENMSLEKAAVAAGVPERAALPLLRDGLDVVARGYGL